MPRAICASHVARAELAQNLERASVHREGSDRPRSNKYSESDASRRPEPGDRDRIWVGGYDRADGTHVEGYYRSAPGK